MIYQEGDLEFNFGNYNAIKLDVQGEPLPEGMLLIDFFVERQRDSLLLEVKDFANPKTLPVQEKKNKNKIIGNELINKSLVPKCRDSYTYIHLMDRDNKPLIYVVLLLLENGFIEPALLLNFSARLSRRLYHEAKEPWKNCYNNSYLFINEG